MTREVPHTGEVVLRVCGEHVALRVTWRVMAELRGLLGPAWDDKVNEAFSDFDMETMAQVLALSSNRSADWWREASPPLIPVSQAYSRAVRLAFYGPDESSEGRDRESPPSPSALTRLLTRSWRGSPPAETANSSGA